MTRRVHLAFKDRAYPKLMHRLGLQPKLWSAELQAIKYADSVRQNGYMKAFNKRKREAAK